MGLKYFDDDRNVVVFSDDPKWCNDQTLFSTDRFMISENIDNRVDLCLMSLCNDFIIANSTFSWWGAILSTKSKIVIAPDPWFKNGLQIKNLIPPNWIKLNAAWED